MFGFGGMPHGQPVSHCFPINMMADPEIQTVANIVATYKNSLRIVQLAGPTFFAPLLKEFRHYVESIVGRNTYPILLILTDGVIHDMPGTIDEVISLAKLPCSIIIVGVGNADFDAMEELDGDGERLRNHYEVAQRDIV